MQLDIDIPDGAPAIRYVTSEFRIDYSKDREIYDTMAQARMVGRRLLRTIPSLNYIDVFHHYRTDNEFTTEEVETLEKVITLDL